MTTILLLSDLHFEFMADKGRSFVDSLDPSNVDVLVLAGDIAGASSIGRALTAFSARFPKAEILYVEGNHEFYNSNRKDVQRTLQNINWLPLGMPPEVKNNVHWLKNSIFKHEGQRFLGTTLWFPQARRSLEEAWSDFNFIADFKDWVYEENKKAVEFLKDNLCEGDAVITHYLPSPACIAPRWQEEPTNCFFVTDLTSLIEERKPALWLFGHTHTSIDVKVGSTRLICNPFGYVNIDENPSFDARFLVTL